MKEGFHTDTVKKLMDEFALGTGLEPIIETPRRYLWTDAFAVCNFLELYARTANEAYMAPCLAPSSIRSMRFWENTAQMILEAGGSVDWTSKRGECIPRRGGLRIGKKVERAKTEGAVSRRPEWDRGWAILSLSDPDGCMRSIVPTRVTGDGHFNGWAIEVGQNVPREVHVRSAFRGKEKHVLENEHRSLLPSCTVHGAS